MPPFTTSELKFPVAPCTVPLVPLTREMLVIVPVHTPPKANAPVALSGAYAESVKVVVVVTVCCCVVKFNTPEPDDKIKAATMMHGPDGVTV